MPLSQPQFPRSHRARPRRLPAAAAPAAAAVLVSVVVTVRAGALTHVWDFLDYGAGVLSLVSLTATVLWGLVATDRVLLGSAHRLLAQGAHRGLAVAGLGFLALHIWVKVAEQHTTATAAFLPFTDTAQPLLVGLGSLAGYLFVAVAVSGAVRSVFATKSRSLWWRALHFAAYPAWGASLVHGLKAGRPASGWVTASYALCLLGVAVLIALRVKSRLTGIRSRPAPAPTTRPLPRPRPWQRPRQRRRPGPRPVVSVRSLPQPRSGSGPGPYAAASAPGRSGERAADRERWS